MEVAVKVIGAVRLGLVDIKDVIAELNTEEMQRVQEIHMLLHESLLYTCNPSSSSTFAEEKANLRSMGPVRTVFFFNIHFSNSFILLTEVNNFGGCVLFGQMNIEQDAKILALRGMRRVSLALD